MSEIKIITKKELLGRNVQVYGTIENPLFLAKDVAEWIEYDTSSINKLVNLVDDEEKVRSMVPTLGGNQEMWMLTEDGLYEVLMQSRKPIAKDFKKGVKDILKTIRKTGSYNSKVPTTFKEALLLAVEQQEIIEQQQLQLVEAAPKVEFFDQVTDSTNAVEMATVAKVLNMGVGRNRLFEILRDNKFLNGGNQPMQRYVDAGYFRVVESKFTKPNGDICINYKTIVYQKGIEAIRKLLKGITDGK